MPNKPSFPPTTPDLDALERAARAAKAADKAWEKAQRGGSINARLMAYDAAATALNEMRNLADEDAILSLIARVRTAEAENAALIADNAKLMRAANDEANRSLEMEAALTGARESLSGMVETYPVPIPTCAEDMRIQRRAIARARAWLSQNPQETK